MRELSGWMRGRTVVLVALAVVLIAAAAYGAGLAASPRNGRGGDVATQRVSVETSASRPAPATARGKQGPRGPRGRRGPEGERGQTGALGDVGPAGSSDEHVTDIGVDWNGTASAAGHEGTGTTLTGIGQLGIECPAAPADDDSLRRLVITPASAARRTVATLTTFQGASQSAASNQRYASEDGSPIYVPIPRNGMISGTIGLEPTSGGSVDPGLLPVADLSLSSSWKENDPVPSANYCHISAQILSEGD